MSTHQSRDARIAEVKAAATALLPELIARSDEINRLRQLPQDIANKLAAAGATEPARRSGLAGSI